MPSSTSGTSLRKRLQSSQTNNQSNNGIIGDGSYNFVTSGNNNQVNITQVATAEEDAELDSLLGHYVSKDALRTSFYSSPECHPGTRTTILDEIGGWIDESRSKKSPLLWLNGPVGVGKSVIAKTISGHHDHIVATYFFSTSSDRSAATLFPTLAWQLARRIPETREHIIASLKSSDSLQTSQIEVQFDLLIVQPLKKITTTRPVMVIDGVDECTDESMLVRFLRVLEQAAEHRPPVRFIICSRPEPRIRAILGRDFVRPDVVPTVNGQEQLPDNLVVGKNSRKVDELWEFALPFLSLILLVIIANDLKELSSSRQPRVILSIAITSTLSVASFTILSPFRPSYSPSSEVRLPTTQQIRNFLQVTSKLFRPIRLGADKVAPSFPASDNALDRICPHPVVSAIQVGLSEECKEDIARYLTDKFNAIRQQNDTTSPWFRPCDVADIVKASSGQFLYASTIVRLLDECSDPREVLNMACHSSLPTPDLNKLYKAILTRAENTIRNQAKEGGSNCQKELRFLTDSLAILVFFAGYGYFSTVRKSFMVIKTLLGLEESKLTWTLRKMHSVFRIVPGETIQVHHRSFLEFLQSRKRSGEYYTSYSNGLQRTLILITRAEFRYRTSRLSE